MFNCSDVEEALEKMCCYYDLITEAYRPDYSIMNEDVILSIKKLDTKLVMKKQDVEGLLTGYSIMLRLITEDRLKFKEVHFTYAGHKGSAEYKRKFDAPVYFEQDDNCLIFDKKYLKQSFAFQNRFILDIFEQIAKTLQKRIRLRGKISDKVSKAVVGMSDENKLNIDDVAKKLAMSRRSLQNRLKQEGITFRELVDGNRKEKADYLLRQTKDSLDDIALMLGFSDQSVFCRAVKRWFGMTPREYRSRNLLKKQQTTQPTAAHQQLNLKIPSSTSLRVRTATREKPTRGLDRPR